MTCYGYLKWSWLLFEKIGKDDDHKVSLLVTHCFHVTVQCILLQSRNKEWSNSTSSYHQLDLYNIYNSDFMMWNQFILFVEGHFSMIMTKIVRHFFVVECEGYSKDADHVALELSDVKHILFPPSFVSRFASNTISDLLRSKGVTSSLFSMVKSAFYQNHVGK